jgi:hypothetical protein
MNPGTQTLNFKNIALEMGLTPKEIVQRKQLLAFTSADPGLPDKIHQCFTDHAIDDFFTESFCRHLCSFSPLQIYPQDVG